MDRDRRQAKQMRSGEAPFNILPDVGILFDNGAYLGPDEIALIEAVANFGTISGAARDVGISYSHAWRLIRELNGAFPRPVIVAVIGEGASSTAFGLQLCAAYRRIQQRTLVAVEKEPLVSQGER